MSAAPAQNTDLDMSKSNAADEALMKLYQLLTTRNAPAAGAFTTLSADERRDYFRVARQRSRRRVRASSAAGAPEPTTANIRDALADAALMIVATSAPGAESILAVVGQVFSQRPGVVMTVASRARQGKLRTKLAKVGGKA